MGTKLTWSEKLLLKKRGFVSRLPENKKAVIVVSGGLDSTVTSARLIEDFSFELFPLHIHRGQTNSSAENRSVDFFTKFFQKKYGEDKFHSPQKISVNIPPTEFKAELTSYSKSKGHPMRDPIILLLGVEYAVAVSEKLGIKLRTVYSANVGDDPFPHCTLEGLRMNTINTCVNMNDWEWQISSPNVDSFLIERQFGKIEEIVWAREHKIPVEETTSCYQTSEKTNFTACGTCKSCQRRHAAFIAAGFADPTVYYDNKASTK